MKDETLNNLTPKQEAFALSYVETGNASEAYRQAYEAGGMKPESINRKAKELLDNGKIAARIDALRAEHVERHKFTVDNMISQLDQDREYARQEGSPAAAVSASMGKAKILGFLTDKIHHSGGTVDVKIVRYADMTDEELARIAAGK